MTLFEILNKIHNEDIKNGTTNLGVCPSFVSANMNKKGGVVTMGVLGEEILKISNDEKIPLLLLIDRKTYENFNKQ